MKQPTSPQVATSGGADPLARLHDIHTPPPVTDWPITPGWWMLSLVVLAGVIGACIWLYRRWRANRYRREAARELERLRARYQADGDETAWLRDYEALLKRVALSRYPRDMVASLTGEAWVEFLDKACGSNDFRMGPGQILIDGNYRPDPEVNIDRLHELGRDWIRRHGNLKEPV